MHKEITVSGGCPLEQLDVGLKNREVNLLKIFYIRKHNSWRTHLLLSKVVVGPALIPRAVGRAGRGDGGDLGDAEDGAEEVCMYEKLNKARRAVLCKYNSPGLDFVDGIFGPEGISKNLKQEKQRTRM